jgi:hypothetical protein
MQNDGLNFIELLMASIKNERDAPEPELVEDLPENATLKCRRNNQ